ncbi:MAG: CAP domain-containing protein [Hymenobacteraceae bacterium]|nr:CAP domain-containing protein [Hymenobacteraceae bacterium]MDX5396821.1 CAP domain-containing protein [Hymenobacteraceae bacterium]MDX5512889.1 CAP domain-containing protein [Hymenobacteraceae bacterium]
MRKFIFIILILTGLYYLFAANNARTNISSAGTMKEKTGEIYQAASKAVEGVTTIVTNKIKSSKKDVLKNYQPLTDTNSIEANAKSNADKEELNVTTNNNTYKDYKDKAGNITKNKKYSISEPGQYSDLLDHAVSIEKDKLLKLINIARTSGCNCGTKFFPPVKSVRWNETLELTALAHSIDMKQQSYFSHKSLTGTEPWDRIEMFGNRYKACGENIAKGQETEEEVVESWLKSPGHCQNIMNPVFQEMGLARSGVYWTQLFATEE